MSAIDSTLPRFQRLQYEFTAHLRDPEHHPAPAGLEDRRVAIYRELVYNNVDSMLSGNFPVIRRITPDHHWHVLIRAFFAEYRSHTPVFPELGREFHRFLEGRNERSAGDPPFLAELAHYEWVEVAAAYDETTLDEAPHDPEGDVVSGCPVVSPLIWVLAYRFPVHRVREDFQPEQAPEQPTLLIVARNRRDEVGFLEVNALSLKLLELVKENPTWTGLDCLSAIAQGFDAGDHDTVIAAGKGILAGFKARDVVLGTRLA